LVDVDAVTVHPTAHSPRGGDPATSAPKTRPKR
jgi:hypothetical protein